MARRSGRAPQPRIIQQPPSAASPALGQSGTAAPAAVTAAGENDEQRRSKDPLGIATGSSIYILQPPQPFDKCFTFRHASDTQWRGPFTVPHYYGHSNRNRGTVLSQAFAKQKRAAVSIRASSTVAMSSLTSFPFAQLAKNQGSASTDVLETRENPQSGAQVSRATRLVARLAARLASPASSG